MRGDPELDVRGSIVLTFIDDTHVLPYVVLHATLQKYWKNPQLQDPQILWSTRYMSSIGAPKPLGGTGSWTENDAASLKATIAAELKQVMHHMLADVAKPVPRDEAHRILVTGNSLSSKIGSKLWPMISAKTAIRLCSPHTWVTVRSCQAC